MSAVVPIYFFNAVHDRRNVLFAHSEPKYQHRVIREYHGDAPVEKTLELPGQFELSLRHLSVFGLRTLAKMRRNIFGTCSAHVNMKNRERTWSRTWRCRLRCLRNIREALSLRSRSPFVRALSVLSNSSVSNAMPLSIFIQAFVVIIIFPAEIFVVITCSWCLIKERERLISYLIAHTVDREGKRY